MSQPRGGEREQRSRLGSMALPLLPCFLCLKHHKNQKSDGSSLSVLVLTVLRGVTRHGDASCGAKGRVPRRRGREGSGTCWEHTWGFRRRSRGRRGISSDVRRRSSPRGVSFVCSR